MARIFKVLSVTSRLRIINLLKQRPFCVNALARILKITPAAVSQHLRVLRDAGLVTAEKKGYFVHYQANTSKLNALNRVIHQLLMVEKNGQETPNNKTPQKKIKEVKSQKSGLKIRPGT